MAAPGELDRVAEQVHKDLLEQGRVSVGSTERSDVERDLAPGTRGAQVVDRLPHQVVERHRRDREPLAPETGEREQILDQLLHAARPILDDSQEPAWLTVESRPEVLLQDRHVAPDRPERRAEIVRNRVGECLQVAVHRGQLRGPELDELPLAPLARVGRDQARVEPAVLDQEHPEHEARRQQAVDPPGVETEVEAARVEDSGERDVEDPRAHHHHEPHVEHRVGPPPPQHREGDQAQDPHARHHEPHRRGVVVAVHDGGQRALAARREQRQPGHRRGHHRHDGQRRGARRPRRRRRGPIVVLEERVAYHHEGETAVPEHVEPRGGLRSRAEKAGRGEEAGKGETVHARHQRGEQVAAREHQERARPEDPELAEEQHRGDQIVDDQGRLIDRDEAQDRGQGHPGQRDRDDEEGRARQDDHERETALARSRWQGREE